MIFINLLHQSSYFNEIKAAAFLIAVLIEGRHAKFLSLVILCKNVAMSSI